MGRDSAVIFQLTFQEISIHSPRMGRDDPTTYSTSEIFDFNPLSPHGERQVEAYLTALGAEISIHSPRMGRDVLT